MKSEEIINVCCAYENLDVRFKDLVKKYKLSTRFIYEFKRYPKEGGYEEFIQDLKRDPAWLRKIRYVGWKNFSFIRKVIVTEHPELETFIIRGKVK